LLQHHSDFQDEKSLRNGISLHLGYLLDKVFDNQPLASALYQAFKSMNALCFGYR
jgi:hypothetical protein